MWAIITCFEQLNILHVRVMYIVEFICTGTCTTCIYMSTLHIHVHLLCVHTVHDCQAGAVN
jgi:hypothetical protein